MNKALKVLLGVVGLFVLIQLVPMGRDHTNPPVTQDAPWPNPEARALAVRACYDCHSNETKWPWYSNVAPVSWLVAHDVDEGREELNFSEFDKNQRHLKDAPEEVREKEMPPAIYFPMHPEAKLTDAERAQLLSAFEAMGAGKEGGHEERR